MLREFDLLPPALTTEGARSRLQTLTAEAEIDVGEATDYLQPHGARRGVIGEVFTRDRGEAQDLDRHNDMGTTEKAYRHLDAEKQCERLVTFVPEKAGALPVRCWSYRRPGRTWRGLNHGPLW